MFRAFRILPEDKALDLLERLTPAEWEVGRTRTAKATGTIKQNREIIPRSDNEPFWADVMAIKDALMGNPGLMQHTLLSKMTVPKFNRYDGAVGGTYQRHFDASPMSSPDMRTDWSYTLFLSPPDSYEGGELCVEDANGTVYRAPKGEPGVAVVYDCGAAHWVNPVTAGMRVAAIGWLRSMVRDPAERRIITRMAEILQRAERDGKAIEPYSKDFTDLTGIQTSLCRKWMDA